jgi:Bacterial PH domain
MNTNKKQFALAPVPAHAYIFVAAICLLPGVITAALWAFNPAEFAAMPVWALALILGIGPLIVLFSLKGVRNPMVTLDSDGLRMRVSFINKQWPLSELNTGQARLVDLQNTRELSPKWKLWGAALPGLSSGLFKLHNGQKAHVYLTDRNKVVYIPTQNGPILLSLERATDFLAALQGK